MQREKKNGKKKRPEQNTKNYGYNWSTRGKNKGENKNIRNI